MSQIVVESILAAAEQAEGKIRVDIDNIKVDKKPGGSINNTSLIRGVILDKEVVHADMPKQINEARIALINSPLEIERLNLMLKLVSALPTK